MTSTPQQSLIPNETGSIHIENICIHFRMRKNSRIKRERLLISPEEGLVVETPDELTLKRAYKMIHKKKKWVLDSMKSIRKKRKQATDIKKFKDSVLIYGQEKIFEIKEAQPKHYILETRNKITVGFKENRIGEGVVDTRLSKWLKAKAKRYLPLRVNKLNNDRFIINKITVKDQQTLWGSCTEDGNLNLNWRVIMAPQFASDYIILHELCHTRYLDHSKNYWKLVGQVCPTYKTAEKWFNDYGFVLHLSFADF